PLLRVIDLQRLIAEQFAILELEAVPSFWQTHRLLDERRHEVDMVVDEILDLRRSFRLVHVAPDLELVGWRRTGQGAGDLTNPHLLTYWHWQRRHLRARNFDRHAR